MDGAVLRLGGGALAPRRPPRGSLGVAWRRPPRRDAPAPWPIGPCHAASSLAPCGLRAPRFKSGLQPLSIAILGQGYGAAVGRWPSQFEPTAAGALAAGTLVAALLSGACPSSPASCEEKPSQPSVQAPAEPAQAAQPQPADTAAPATLSKPRPVRRPAVRRVKVAREADVEDGELRQVLVPASADGLCSEGAILLARVDGQFYATGASCSHYSAPLAQGVAAKDKLHVVCPWHDAAFDLRTGQPVRGCGLQAIPTYAVSVENGNVVVDLPRNMEDFVDPAAMRRSPDDHRLFLVIGGGAAGVAACDALRQEGYTGRVMLVSEEKHYPYDRPVLSKNLAKASDVESIALRDQRYFAAHDIEFRPGARVAHLDAGKRVARLASGEELHYDCALVATGAKPRALPVPGGDLPKVMGLRTPEDAQNIALTCTAGKRVLVVGSSFIGMELAATLTRRECKVTVMGVESVPFERVLGRRLGEAFKVFFQSKGVKFLGESRCTEIQLDGSGLRAVLQNGQLFSCDAVVAGVGVVPNATFVMGAEKAKDGSLITDEYLRTSAEGLFAAGDVASYRSPASGEHLRIEHWDVAMSQGRTAAKSMLGVLDTFSQTPFFWTSLFGKNLRYVGHCTRFDELLVDGNYEKLSFVAYYCHEGVVKAVATMGRDPTAVAVGELMRLGKMPSADDLKEGRATTLSLAADLKRMCQAD